MLPTTFEPTATQSILDEQDTAWKSPCGRTAAVDHDRPPSLLRIMLAELDESAAPTATQTVGDAHDTPESPVAPPGCAAADQDVPPSLDLNG